MPEHSRKENDVCRTADHHDRNNKRSQVSYEDESRDRQHEKTERNSSSAQAYGKDHPLERGKCGHLSRLVPAELSLERCEEMDGVVYSDP